MKRPVKKVPAAQAPKRWPEAAICMALAALTLVVFLRATGNGFVDYDDNDYVYGNPVVRQGLSFTGFFWAFGRHADNWHPLTWLSHMLDCQLYGLNPAGHHLTSVLLHTATVVALFLVLRRMTGARWRSAFVAAVFAVHPLRVESVAWVAERKDVLSGFFFVLTIGAYVRYAQGRRTRGAYFLILLCFALGLMSKPMLVTVPLVLLLLDFWPLRRPERLGKLVLEKVPMLVLSAASCAATLLAQQRVVRLTESFSLSSRVANALVSCAVYLGQMVWPAGLVVFYPCAQNGVPGWEAILAAAFLVLISGLVIWQRRKRPWLLTGWTWYLIMLLPVLGLIQAGRQAQADRYTYLPQIGIYMAATWLAAQWIKQPSVAALGMIGIVAALAICAWHQIAFWKNTDTLWTRDLAFTTSNDKAHFALGLERLEQGQIDAALPELRQALAIRPDNVEARLNLGVALERQGQTEEAIEQYQEASKIEPDNPLVHLDYGSALQRAGRVDEAITHFRAAAQSSPNVPAVHVDLGFALAAKELWPQAVHEFQTASQLDGKLLQAHYGLGDALAHEGKLDEAIAQLQDALAINPNYENAQKDLAIVTAQKRHDDEQSARLHALGQTAGGTAEDHFKLANMMLQNGNLDDAIHQLQEGLRLDPKAAPARLNLGMVLLQTGGVDDAIAQFRAALSVNTNYAAAYNGLGNAFLRENKWSEAIRNYDQAVRLNPTDPTARNNLAWILATCPDSPLRNGARAVELARQADRLAGGGNPIVLHTLAAALAETGRFADAVTTAQKAIESARSLKQQDLAAQFSGELRQYQAGRPLSAAAKE